MKLMYNIAATGDDRQIIPMRNETKNYKATE